jgi:MscS family membrane protein
MDMRYASILSAICKAVLLITLLQASSAAQRPYTRPAQASPPAAALADPLGRTTPIGTVAGFTSAVRHGNVETAAQYLQLTPAQRPDAEALARDLAALIERFFTQPITALSSQPEGSRDDTLPPDRDRLVLSIDGKSVDIGLVRITDAHGNLVWLISSDTLAEVPSLSLALHPTWIQVIMPRALVARSLFGISLAQWIVYAASIGAPLLLLWVASRLVIGLARRKIMDARRPLLDTWGAGLTAPLIVTGTLAAHFAVMPFLGFPLTFRLAYARLGMVVAVAVLAWLVWRLLTLSAAQAELAAQRRGHAGTRSLMLLGERVFKVLILVLTVLTILAIAGVNTTTALAGLGIGGIAVALGAQKSIENLLGGVFLLTDKALAVGDLCRVSERTGWIEDITLRSVRVRTLEQTLLSIPAGALAQANIENFSTRGKMPIQSTLRLQYGTTSEQLRKVIRSVQDVLDRHAQLEPGSARIRLVNLGAQALELELFAYVLTIDGQQFMTLREDILLQVTEIVESSGTAFARPDQSVKA